MITFPTLFHSESNRTVYAITGGMITKTNGIVARGGKEPASSPMLFQSNHIRAIMTGGYGRNNITYIVHIGQMKERTIRQGSIDNFGCVERTVIDVYLMFIKRKKAYFVRINQTIRVCVCRSG